MNGQNVPCVRHINTLLVLDEIRNKTGNCKMFTSRITGSTVYLISHERSAVQDFEKTQTVPAPTTKVRFCE